MARRAALGLALFSCLPGCGGGVDPRPSVVIVLVDQLRADAAERWLSATSTLAERGVRASAMRSVAPWTYPSVISLLSGLYPQQHGADADETGKRLTVFSGEVPLLPRTLRAEGYDTAGFVTNPFLHEWNPVHAAFDHYDASFIGNQGARRGHGELVWTERMFADSLVPALRAHYDARSRRAPEFTYVHLIDVHGRAEGPERWKGAPFPPSYEGAVRYVDERIAELHAYFTERNSGNLIFVVTSDHGQDFEGELDLGEGRPWRARKASLHDFNLRIPFLVLPGTPVPAGVVWDEPCLNIDVVPTLHAWLGLPPPDAPGQRLPTGGLARELYARTSGMGRFEEALLFEGQKYLRTRLPASSRRRFDLAQDPREAGPQGGDFSREEARLEAFLAAPLRAFRAHFEDPEAELLEGLDALGYGGAEPGR